MLQDFILKGSTDKSVRLRIIDSADGTPETGVVFNTSGIDLWYRRELAARVAITEATLAALTTTHADGGFLHISDGYYRLDLPDAAFATGANYVEFGGVVTGMVVIGGLVKLIDSNIFHDTVRGGFTALPNAAADAAGGLPISDAGGLDLDAQLVTKINDILTDTGTTLQGELDAIQAAVITNAAGTDIAADIIAIKTVVDAIKVKSDNLPTDPADASDIAAAIAALNDLSAAEVNQEVVDALATDTYAEPTGVPGATLALSAKISWVFMALRNGLTVTADKKTFLDDGGAGEWSKSLSDDATTYTEGEAGAP